MQDYRNNSKAMVNFAFVHHNDSFIKEILFIFLLCFFVIKVAGIVILGVLFATEGLV